MKKNLVIVASFFVLTSSLFAASWSGIFDNNTKLSTGDFKNFTLDQSNGIHLSLTTPINQNLRFAGEILYKYELNAVSNSTTFKNIADLTLFKLNGLWKTESANVSLDFGRFKISDLSNTVFTQTSDGLNLQYETANWKIGLYGGYTGLINSLNVSMTDSSSYSNDFYRLSVGYIPASINYSYTSLFDSNVIGFQAYYFKGITKNLTDKIYGELSLSGPISTAGSYSAVVVAGLDDLMASKKFMIFAKADYSAYLGKKGILGLGVDFASKDFVTITTSTASSSGIPLAGVLVPRLNAMYVNKNFVASITEKVILQMNEPSFAFAGVDSALTVLFNVFSDLQIGCDVNAFIGKKSDENKYSVTAKVNFAF